jgi:hypothetical protein
VRLLPSRGASRDLVTYLRGVEEKLEQHDAATLAIQKHLAHVDHAQEAFNLQMDVLRAAINEEFRRLREGILGHG